MKIKLDDNYFVEVDKYSFDLKRYTGKKDKDGNAITQMEGYFPSVAKAVRKYIDLVILEENEEMTLNEYTIEYAKHTNRIANLLKGKKEDIA